MLSLSVVRVFAVFGICLGRTLETDPTLFLEFGKEVTSNSNDI